MLKKSDKPNAQTKKHTWSWQRSTRIVATGSRSKMIDTLATFGEVETSRRDGVVANVTASPRFETGSDRARFTGSEHTFALVTVGVEEKQASNFETWWASAPFPQTHRAEA